MDDGAEPIEDKRVAEALRNQARGIQVHALLLAIALTALTMLLLPM